MTKWEVNEMIGTIQGNANDDLDDLRLQTLSRLVDGTQILNSDLFSI